MFKRRKGHRLTLEWSGEYGAESSSTGHCPCGWSESASSQDEVRCEYQYHLEHLEVIDRHAVEQALHQFHGDIEIAIGRSLGEQQVRDSLLRIRRRGSSSSSNPKFLDQVSGLKDVLFETF